MTTIRAIVHEGKLVVDETSDLPEGTVVQLLVVDEGDALDEIEKAALDAAIDEAAESVDRGEGIPADEALRRLLAG